MSSPVFKVLALTRLAIRGCPAPPINPDEVPMADSVPPEKVPPPGPRPADPDAARPDPAAVLRFAAELGRLIGRQLAADPAQRSRSGRPHLH